MQPPATPRPSKERSIQQWRIDGAAEGPNEPLVLALHGMGMDHDSFAHLLRPLFDLPVRFLIPKAPLRAPKGGASWYEYNGDQEHFRRELEETELMLQEFLVRAENDGGFLPRGRVLLGFSQGGYCGAYVAVRNAETFSGMVISGARVKTEILEKPIHEAARRGFAALLCHGQRDRAVKPQAAETSYRALVAGGIRVDLQRFDSGHTLSRAQVGAIRQWLSGHFRLH